MNTSLPVNPSKKIKLAEPLVTCLAEKARKQNNLWLLDSDLGDSYGFNHEVIASLGNRFVQSGIAEQTMLSVAAGLSLAGKRPWVFSFAAFLVSRAYDQIRTGISQTDLPVFMVGANSGISSIKNGKTHLCLNDVSLISSLPGIDIWSPYQSSELVYMIDMILAADKPAYIRLPKFGGVENYARYNSPLSLYGKGNDALILSTGIATEWAIEVQSRLRQQSISITVAHVSRIRPLPTKLLDIISHQYNCIVTLEDHYIHGGFGDIVATSYRHKKIHKLGWPELWLDASQNCDEFRSQYLLDNRGIVKTVLTLI